MPTRGVLVRKQKPPATKTLADKFVDVIGSWNFIVGQSLAMVLWVCLNLAAPAKPDPYPFILLNLMLSTQAALLGPIILMSSNRQGEIDRKRDEDHYLIDVRESEIVEGMAAELEEIAKRLKEHDERGV